MNRLGSWEPLNCLIVVASRVATLRASIYRERRTKRVDYYLCDGIMFGPEIGRTRRPLLYAGRTHLLVPSQSLPKHNREIRRTP